MQDDFKTAPILSLSIFKLFCKKIIIFWLRLHNPTYITIAKQEVASLIILFIGK